MWIIVWLNNGTHLVLKEAWLLPLPIRKKIKLTRADIWIAMQSSSLISYMMSVDGYH